MENLVSVHYANDRLVREHFIKQLGKAYVVKTVRWDRGHRNGAEIHKILSNGVIEIYNENTNILCTKIIATPSQIERYWETGKAPWWLVDKARQNRRNGLCV